MNRVVGFIVSVVLVLGIQFYKKDSARDDVKQELIEICEDEGACTQSVDIFFDGCFEQGFTPGSRHRAPVLDMNVLLDCINLSAGEEIFGVEKVD